MSPYPIILNGDHAEFEQEHINTPPHERPDWPLPSFDAADWAAAFCKIANGFGYKDSEGKPIDEGWMQTWFANALMRGFDEYASRTITEICKNSMCPRGGLPVQVFVEAQ